MQSVDGVPDVRVLFARIVFGGVAAAVSLAILLRPVPERVGTMPRPRFDGVLIGLYALLRVVLFALVYGVMRQEIRGDLLAYYLPQGRYALHGMMPYRDYYSSYAPLNSPLNGLLLRLYDSGLTLIVFEMVCDVAGLAVLLAVLRRFLDETTVRRAGLLMLVQPLLLWNTTIDGRNEAFTALLLFTAILYIGRRDVWSGAFASSTLVFVKFLPLLYLPTMLAAAKRRGLWVLGAALLPVPVFGYMVWQHYPVLQPLLFEGTVETSGGIGYMVLSLTGWTVSSRVIDAVTGLCLLAVLVWTGWAIVRASSERVRLWALSLAMAALMMTLVALSKKTYPAYLTAVSGLMVAYVARVAGMRGRKGVAWLYAMLIFTSLFASSLAYVGLGGALAAWTHHQLMTGSALAMASFLFVCMPSICCVSLVAYMMRDSRGFAETAE